MKKTQSEKNLVWIKKDYVRVISIYIINFFIIMAMFLTKALLSFDSFDSFLTGYCSDVKNILSCGLFLLLTLTILYLYFIVEDKNFIKLPSNAEMIFLIIELSLAVDYVIKSYVGLYLRPLAIATLLTLFLTNRRNSIFITIIFTILLFVSDVYTGSLYSYPYYSVIVSFGTSMMATYLMDKTYSRLSLLLKGFLISIPAVCYYLASLDFSQSVLVENIIMAVCSGFCSVVVFMVLLPIFEWIFRRVSSFKLAELTSHKAKLIKRLIKEAPGTFNHSIVVSNIAEACALAIEEDALLTRTCAYYHDIGKLRRPEYFKENQIDDMNPHDGLMPELSANIIKAHVKDGYQFAIKNGLPQVIADVCLQHHGTLPIIYFYDKAKKMTDGEVDITQYSYFGPKPQTKIAAIIMIADSCEAASRSITDFSRENVTKVVRKNINDRMNLGQFDECDITIKELNIIMRTVVNNLAGIYHSRVEYPHISFDTEEVAKVKDIK